jgi:hypothetical protein
MPYPVAHLLFFIFCINAIAVCAAVRSIFHRELSFTSSMRLMLLLLVGSLCSLFLEMPIVYNLLVNCTMGHSWIGTVPTHSLLFSFLQSCSEYLQDILRIGRKVRQYIWAFLAKLHFFLIYCWRMPVVPVVFTCIQYTIKLSACSH